jgi:predicted nucleotidyltransferase
MQPPNTAFSLDEPIPNYDRDELMSRLRAAEIEHDVKIVYACESGSRAWGFASPDSDFDVRVLYVRRTDWYMSFDIERWRDIIEYPIVDDMDCSGWDLRKALYLFTRTNGALLEWLNSPINYISAGPAAARLRNLAPKTINSIARCYHYSHMARGNARGYLCQDSVRLKKYFYVLRPLLAIRYIQAGMGAPPIEFQRLVDAVAPPQLHDSIELKSRTKELGEGPPVSELQSFIETELEAHGKSFHGEGRPDLLARQEVVGMLNTVFREAVHHAWL